MDNNSIAAGTSTQLELVLSNSTGAALITPNVASLFIMDDEFDTPRQPPNIIDDTQFFVRQQYFDFLNREPDAAGFNFWTNQILSCGTDQQCIELKRINVSAAFFLSIEFQKTGMLAYLTERATTGALPRYGPFMRDVQALQKDYVFGAPGRARNSRVISRLSSMSSSRVRSLWRHTADSRMTIMSFHCWPTVGSALQLAGL